MEPGDPGNDAPQRDHLLELIQAVARGDAARGDIVTALRHEGVDALDVVIAVLEQAAKAGPGASVRNSRALNPQRSAATPPAGRDARIVHREPKVPFLLNGTLYEPHAIERFQGQELHFIPAASRDQMVVIDDRQTMTSWWQLSYLSSNVNIRWEPQPIPPTPEPGVPEPPGSPGRSGFSITPGEPGPPRRAFLFEHTNYRGERLELEANRGYYDLTKVGFGFLGLDDWNDKISSIHGYETQITVLHDHVGWTGSTFSTQGEWDLTSYGWNDRASSVETW